MRGPKPRPAADRFWAMVEKSECSCWQWKGFTVAKGHGKFRSGSRNYFAHRFAYEQMVGPIPNGKHLHHLCENPSCVRPDHLQPLTPAEHVRVSPNMIANIASRRTHCPHGHAYTLDNIYFDKGCRRCRTCVLARVKARNQRLGTAL